MIEGRPLDVVFCWHMHQPQYRRARDGVFRQPWTYLHGIKDYADMVWHLEQTPEARAVVNFTPVLLEQLDDYIEQFATRRFRDPILSALADPASVAASQRPAMIDALLRANPDRMIARHAPYARLAAIRDSMRANGDARYLSVEFLTDLAVWFHLAWLGESVVRADARAARLIAKGAAFDADDRAALLHVMGDTLTALVPRYRALADQGRLELSTSPQAHPILPLLLDFAVARMSIPDAPLPAAPAYPGGAERAAAQVRSALESHRARFGSAALGCWPSEGAVSTEAAALLARAGFAWTASCESVLARTLRARDGDPGARANYLYKPHRIGLPGASMPCFFRDVHLSDLIGFRYADWHGDDAVANFVGELLAIADATADQPQPVVSIILDGENAWEHYPENGYYFLSGLYRAIAAQPRLRMTTFSQHLASRQSVDALGALVAGSWVYGTLSTWIGDADKNRAWDLLVRAKTGYDAAVAAGGLSRTARAAAERQLAVCEGSDWFWWYGAYNPAQSVAEFDRLYRDHVRDLYALFGTPPPPEIDAVIGTGTGAPVHGGTMRQNPDPAAGA